MMRARRSRLLSVGRRDAGRLRLVGTALSGSLLVLALAAVGQLAYAGVARIAAPAAESSRGQPSTAGLSPAERAALAAKVAYLNRLLEQDAVPWTGLLADLEAALPADAYLTEIRPDGPTGRVRFSGVAASGADVGGFVRRLEGRAGIGDVFLVQQADRAAATGEGGVGFTLSIARRSGP